MIKVAIGAYNFNLFVTHFYNKVGQTNNNVAHELAIENNIGAYKYNVYYRQFDYFCQHVLMTHTLIIAT